MQFFLIFYEDLNQKKEAPNLIGCFCIFVNLIDSVNKC